MKKINLTLVLVLSYIASFGQTLIIEENFKDGNIPVGYNFLPNANRIIIEKGQFVLAASNKIIKTIMSYDSDGFYEKLSENDELVNCIFSPTESAFISSKKTKNPNDEQQFKLVIDGKSSPFFKMDNTLQYFNDENQFGFLNQDNQPNINFEKDNLTLNITNITTRANEKIKFYKPDLKRILGGNNVKYANNITFGVRVNEYNFGIITKSITKDYKSSTLYRSIYSYGGVQLFDYAYKVQIPEKSLIYSNNGGGVIYTNPQTEETYVSDLAINNFVIDPTSEEVYVYGLYGENAKNSSNISNIPVGFYVVKFDKEGNKIWQSNQPINDALDFNTNQNITAIKLGIVIRNSDVLVSISSDESKKKYLHYAVLDISNGFKLKNSKINFDNMEVKNPVQNQFVNASFKINNIGNKFFDKESLFAYSNNEKFSSYMNGLKNHQNLYFKSFFGKKGVWLIETDNITYYKALFFKD